MDQTADVIAWPRPVESETAPDLLGKIENTLALLRAIDAGELLAALPECAVARTQHMTALTLLKLAERELAELEQAVKA